MRHLHRAAALAALLATAPLAAQPRPLATSLVEHAFGASPVYMVAGHGALTAGVTREGDLAVLAWPGPSCCDQLTHLASNALDARERPRTGVREGLGVALGLALRTASGTQVAWLHDATRWTATPGYADERSLQPRIAFEHTSLGVRVVLHDAVLPDRDVLQRRVTVTRAPGSPVTGVALLTHANLGLTLNVVPRLPLGDVIADNRNDFGALWDPARRAVVHFRPADRAPVNELIPLVTPAPMPADFFGPLDALLRERGDVTARAAALARDLDTTYGRGVYAMVATDPPPDQFHVGREGGEFCEELGRLLDNVVTLGRSGLQLPLDPNVANTFRCPPAVLPDAVARERAWTREARGAWAEAQDGELPGDPVGAYLTDSALRTPVPLDAEGRGEARVLFAFGATAAAAGEALAAARDAGADAVITRDRAAWEARAGALRLPDRLPDTLPAEDRARIVRAARRALLHVYNGTDRATGAIVASIARQAPYGLDWPRDGAFFDYALDVAGDPAAVSRRLAWALPLARRAPLSATQVNLLVDPRPPTDPRNGRQQYPEAAWEMNYYATGAMGGFIRFEIDNTALMVWTAAAHVAYAPEAERAALATRYWEAVRPSADLLADWRDAATGLQAPANEDDNTAFTATLHGGTAVFAGLEGAARLARFLGHATEAARWERRASELRDALVRAFYDEGAGRFVNRVEGAAQTNPGSSPLGATAWLVWPAELLPASDPRLARQMRHDLERVLASLRGAENTEGGAYLTKTTLAAAVYLANGGDPTLRPLVEEALARLARDILTQDTQVMGEVFVTRRNPDGTVAGYENRVSIPHLWEATLFYLSAMALSAPDRFDLDRRLLPANLTPPPGTVPLPSPAADAGAMDAGATPTPPGDDGCGCRVPAPSGPSSARLGWLVALATLTATRARRPRRGGR